MFFFFIFQGYSAAFFFLLDGLMAATELTESSATSKESHLQLLARNLKAIEAVEPRSAFCVCICARSNKSALCRARGNCRGCRNLGFAEPPACLHFALPCWNVASASPFCFSCGRGGQTSPLALPTSGGGSGSG